MLAFVESHHSIEAAVTLISNAYIDNYSEHAFCTAAPIWYNRRGSKGPALVVGGWT